MVPLDPIVQLGNMILSMELTVTIRALDNILILGLSSRNTLPRHLPQTSIHLTAPLCIHLLALSTLAHTTGQLLSKDLNETPVSTTGNAEVPVTTVMAGARPPGPILRSTKLRHELKAGVLMKSILHHLGSNSR